MNSKVYLHDLPHNCPPSDAHHFSDGTVVLRLARCNPPTEDDFKPNSMLPHKKLPAGGNECNWGALSVWDENAKREDIAGITKIPKNYDLRYLVKIKVGKNTGRVKATGKNGHYSLWLYAGSSVGTEIISVEEVNQP